MLYRLGGVLVRNGAHRLSVVDTAHVTRAGVVDGRAQHTRAHPRTAHLHHAVVARAHIIQHLRAHTLEQRRLLLAQRRQPVDPHLVHSGLAHYRLLAECLPPGCAPDVPFMAALLELRAPLLAKAAFLLETAFFVSRCNRKDWPAWIRLNVGPFVPTARAARNGSVNVARHGANPLKRSKVFGFCT